METKNLIVRRRNGNPKDTNGDLKEGLQSAKNEIKRNTLAEKSEELSLVENELSEGNPGKIMEGLSPAENEIPKYNIGEILEKLSTADKAHLLDIQANVQNRLFSVKREIYNIGKLLYKAKEKLPHGMFIPWMELTFNNDLPYSTGHFYMRVYDIFKENVSTVQYIPTKYLLMITNKDFPEEIVKVLNEHPKKINEQGLQEIKEIYGQFKDGTIDSDKFIKLAKKQIKLGYDILKGREKHRLNRNTRHSLEYGTLDLLKRINKFKEVAKEMANMFPPDLESPEHKKLLSDIEETIKGLQDLKSELDGGRSFFKAISTEGGDKLIPNL